MNRFAQRNDEKGGVVVLFAILVTTSIIIAMFVMVFDVGSIYSERRVQQKSADSAVLATAQECALLGVGNIYGVSTGNVTPLCESALYSKTFATQYTNANSPDNLTKVTELCGTGSLPLCNPGNSGTFECKPVNNQYKNYVRVRTETLQQTGDSIPALFRSLIDSSDNTTKVVGCSQAAWGKANAAKIQIPIALPICEYSYQGTKIIKDFDSNNPVVVGGCTITDLEQRVFNYTSPTQGFSFLSDFGCPGISDFPAVSVGTTLNIQSSLAQVEAQCPNGQSQFYSQVGSFVNKQFFVPVVTSVICQSGSNNCQGNYKFQVATFFSFKMIGGKFRNRGMVGSSPTCLAGDPCQRNDGWPSYCDANISCLYGTLERAIVPGSDVSLDPNFPAVGAMAVQLLP
jgi:Flp pilus assembly protein TadG